MNKVVVLCEGPSERNFIQSLLNPVLIPQGVKLECVFPGKSSGVKSWGICRRDILAMLKSGDYCTTFVDYYALPQNWPGRKEAATFPWDRRAEGVQQAIHSDICSTMGSSFNPSMFIPYVQMHEFEALLFSDMDKLFEELKMSYDQIDSVQEKKLRKALEECGNPEAINDQRDTSPSHRIKSCAPAYSKALKGVDVAKAIGLDKIRSECANFNEWMSRLERLSASLEG